MDKLRKSLVFLMILTCSVSMMTWCQIPRVVMASDVPTLAEIQSQLDTLAETTRPYLVMDSSDVSDFLYDMTERQFSFEGDSSRTVIDADYLQTLKDSDFGPIYSYMTGEDKEEETEDFWDFYEDAKENEANASAVSNYKGDQLRPVWAWLIDYHFIQDFGYSTTDEMEDLYDYTSDMVETLYEMQGHSDTVPEILESITGMDFTDYSRHNYHAEVIGIMFYYAMVFPEDENSATYFQYAYQEFENLMEEGVYDGGAWNESPRYAGAILRTWVPLFKDIKRLMGYDLFQNSGFKSMLSYFVETQTPSNLDRDSGDDYFAGRTPAIGDTIWTTDWDIFLAMAAPAYTTTDPDFAGELMYTWEEAGSPNISNRVREEFSISSIDPDITAVQPDYESAIISEEKGEVILQSDRGESDEQWLMFRSGADAMTSMPLSQHQHSDKNSFSLFAFGYPLILDPGITDYDDDETEFLRSTPAHNNMDYAKYLSPNLLYATLYGDEQMEYTMTDGSITDFETNDTYERVQGTVEKTGLNGLIEEGPYTNVRDIIYVKQGYYIIRDTVDVDSEASLHFNALSDDVEISGNQVIMNHPSGDVHVQMLVLNHGNISLSDSEITLPNCEVWGDSLTSVEVTSQTPEEDGFLTILYPYEDGDEPLTAVYDDTTKEIRVTCKDRTDLISFDDSTSQWDVETDVSSVDTDILYCELTMAGSDEGGDAFDDYNDLYEKMTEGLSIRPTSISVSSGSRIDSVTFGYADGTSYTHGGDGGTRSSVNIPDGQGIQEIIAYNGEKSGSTRVFGLQFVFTDGSVSDLYGTETDDQVIISPTLSTGSNLEIVGLYGHSGDELDELGAIVGQSQS